MKVTINQICRSGWSISDNVQGNEYIKARKIWTLKLQKSGFITL